MCAIPVHSCILRKMVHFVINIEVENAKTDAPTLKTQMECVGKEPKKKQTLPQFLYWTPYPSFEFFMYCLMSTFGKYFCCHKTGNSRAGPAAYVLPCFAWDHRYREIFKYIECTHTHTHLCIYFLFHYFCHSLYNDVGCISLINPLIEIAIVVSSCYISTL